MARHTMEISSIKEQALKKIAEIGLSSMKVLIPRDLYPILGGRNRTYWLLATGVLPAQRSRKGGIYRLLRTWFYLWLEGPISIPLTYSSIYTETQKNHWISLTEAASYLRVHLGTARRWIDDYGVGIQNNPESLLINQTDLMYSLIPLSDANSGGENRLSLPCICPSKNCN